MLIGLISRATTRLRSTMRARRLLAEGADPGDTVETWRSGVLSMSGVIGELAKWQAAFATRGPHLMRHKTYISGSLAAETAAPVHSGIPAPEGRPA